jgi:hypothetical protein
MQFQDVLLIVVVLAACVIVLLLVWGTLIRRQIPTRSEAPKSAEAIADARMEAEELTASVVSEQIEEMVRQRLIKYPEYAGVKLDFGTSADGSLQIWIDGERYDDLEEIPDTSIREAIKDAVAEFNR